MLLLMQGIQPAPVFRPTEEEFKDPLAYINSCRPEVCTAQQRPAAF